LNEQNANRLAGSASPYLRSAAHQPVQWFEWGEEAFAKARAEDKPILLDIGAVWCHWCHVIDRESYEDPQLAEVINRLFIPVKVDRDERPDVDARYQTAVSAISGQGGWPLTGFLLPDGRPFFGGTYFPPQDAMGRPSFRRVLEHVAAAYSSQRGEVESAAGALVGAVARAELFDGGRGDWSAEVLEQLTSSIAERFDQRQGGFSHAPKFPHSGAIDFLLERYQATGDPKLLHIVHFTLEHMARGGVYDQLGGGFHRYSVDERWLVPHFEKMSYDNSELLKNYLHAYLVTRVPFFRQTAEGIIDWVNGVLCDPERGGFYASQDADVSLDDDGDYFTWTQEEVRAALPPDQARVIELYYDVGPSGEMHHNPAKNVLWVARDPETIANGLGINADEVSSLLEEARAELLDARATRKTPFVDTTLYTSWNGMFISAYLEAAGVLDDWRGAACRDFALRTLDRFLAEGWDEKRGFTHRLGAEWLYGSLDDQAQMMAALLDAFEATLERRYFDAAERTAALVLEKYGDSKGGGFFDRSADAPPMGGLDVRRKPLQDSPTPAGNPVTAMVLDRLYAYTGESRYLQAAGAALDAFAGLAPQYGLFAATYGLASVLHARHPLQIVVTGAEGDATAEQLAHAARAFFRFGKAVLRVTPERLASAALPATFFLSGLRRRLGALTERQPALGETIPHLQAGMALALVCAGMRCYPPVRSAEALRELLGQIGRESQAAAG
jgi:uncharacterized protein YyaL (SSP411 family)